MVMMKRILYISTLVVTLAACSTAAKLKYAEELYNKKAYADAAAMCKDIKEPDQNTYVLWANAEYNMLHMNEAARAYSKANLAELSEANKFRYAQALRETGAEKEAARIINSIQKNGSNTQAIEEFLHPATATKNEIKVNTYESTDEGDEYSPFYFKDSLCYVTNSRGNYSPKSDFPYNGMPFTRIESKTDNNVELKKLNSNLNDGPVAVSTNSVVFNRSVPSTNKKREHVTLFEKSIDKLLDNSKTELPFCADTLNYMHPSFKSENTLVFSSNHNFTNDTKSGNYDLYVTTKTNGTWSKPQPFSANVNSDYDEQYPSFLSDSILIFSANKPTGYGGLDLYTTSLNYDGTWSKPRLLPAPINSSYDDFGLIADPKDDHHVFFTSNRNGSDDIMQTTIPEEVNGEWKIQLIDGKVVQPLTNFPINLQYELIKGEKEARLTDDKGYFDGNTDGGINTISSYFYKTTQVKYPHKKYDFFTTTYQTVALLPIEKWLVTGVLTDVDTGQPIEGATVQFKGTVNETVTTDENGKFSFTAVNLDKNSYVDIILSRKGYDEKTLTHVNVHSKNTQIDINETQDLTMKRRIQVGEDLADLLKLDPIYFETAKWDITEQGAIQLDKIVAILIQKPNLVIECGSHTDCRGSRAANQILSDNRAKATADFLLAHGIPKSQIKYKGYGEDKPVNDCRCEGEVSTTCTEEELALNRRTEFRVIKDLDPERTRKEEDIFAARSKEDVNKVVEERSTYVQPENILAWLKSDNNEYKFDPKIKSRLEENPKFPEKVFFTVQIGAFAQHVHPEFYAGLFPVFSDHDGIEFTRICVGKFTSYEKAEEALTQLCAKYPDAFIAAYSKGKRIAVQEAHKLY